MKTNGEPQDPRWTAYALDEMESGERLAFEEEAGGESQARQNAEPILETANLLRVAFAREQAQYPRLRPVDKIIRPAIWKRSGFWAGAIAALFMVSLASLAIYQFVTAPSPVANNRPDHAPEDENLVQTPVMRIHVAPQEAAPRNPRETSHIPTLAFPITMEAPLRTVASADGKMPVSPATLPASPTVPLTEMPFLDSLTFSQSRMPIRVGEESIAAVENSLRQGQFPTPDAVRIEEWVNHFSAPPIQASLDPAQPVHVSLEVAACPWDESHRLAKVTVTSAATDAREAAIQVKFNVLRVSSYRLIGYARPAAPMETAATPTMELLPSGQSATAFYELVLVESTVPANPGAKARKRGEVRLASIPKGTLEVFQVSPELMTVRVDYGKPGDSSRQKVERTLADNGATFFEASREFRFAAAVAGFGLKLRTPGQLYGFTFGDCADIATESASGPEGQRLAEMAVLAERLERTR